MYFSKNKCSSLQLLPLNRCWRVWTSAQDILRRAHVPIEHTYTYIYIYIYNTSTSTIHVWGPGTHQTSMRAVTERLNNHLFLFAAHFPPSKRHWRTLHVVWCPLFAGKMGQEMMFRNASSIRQAGCCLYD